MTQEELDALMGEDIGDIDDIEESSDDSAQDLAQEIEESVAKEKETEDDDKPYGYNNDTSHQWPLPATEENQMVHQLDDVTKESEEKASEIFDIIENISNEMMEKEENITSNIETIQSNIDLFTTLGAKFPEVEAFSTQLERNKGSLDNANAVLEMLQNSGDEIMSVMDIMQYQDIHRQKIERVINVMRALSKYMNTLFEGRIDDDKRVSSAQHLAGDTHNDLASTDDIEALLAQFGS